jgi:hypothetical protein
MKKIVLGILGVLSTPGLVSPAQAQQSFTSPDSQLRAVILPVCEKQGLENTESAVEIHLSTGKLLYRQAYSSPDCGHGMRVVRAEWTPDSQFFVFSTQPSGESKPWQYLTLFYARRLNGITDLDKYVDPIVTPNFALSAPNTIQTKAVETRERPTHLVKVSLGRLVRSLEKHKHDSEIFHPPDSGWIGFSTGPETVERGPYRITQQYDPDNLVGRIFIQREKDAEPRLIFTNQRGVEFLIGHRGELALINSTQSTKDYEVYVTNFGTGESRRIDEQALRMFSHNSGADPSLLIVAAGEALSPDDQEALLAIKLIYISVSTREEADRAGKTFKKWWYAVSTSTGQVLHEYRATSVPRAWRTAYRQ